MKIHFLSTLIGLAVIVCSTSDAAAQTEKLTGAYYQADVHPCGCGVSASIVMERTNETVCISAELFQDLPGMPAPPFIPERGAQVTVTGNYKLLPCNGSERIVFVVDKISAAE